MRVTVDQVGTVIQKDDYYPFGGTFQHFNIGDENQYKFNGNEVQVEVPNVADFNARFYDASIGRFMMIDPLAEVGQESWTPYHYSYNNPILINDPSGLLPKYNWETGQYEDDDGSVVSFEDALSAHRINLGQNENQNVDDQDNKNLIDLSKSDAGLKIVDALRNYFTAKDADPSTPGLFLEDFIDLNTQLGDAYGFGPITSVTKGSRKMGAKYVKIKIWIRTDLKVKPLEQNSDNSIRSFTTQLGSENPVNGLIYTNITIRNGSGKGIIQFEIVAKNENAAIKQNVEFIKN
ncbi:MAG: RHS repeat-associated core domain-containing protein [Cyclobacteriaceae bacterium]